MIAYSLWLSRARTRERGESSLFVRDRKGEKKRRREFGNSNIVLELSSINLGKY